MTPAQVVTKTEKYVRDTLEGEGSGHDWWHVYRVWKMAKHIAKKEGNVDILIVELGALLHDIADWKFHNGDHTAGARTSEKWLETLELDPKVIAQVCEIVEHVSFKGAGEKNGMKSREGKIVQDADRLDALGAIGIARTFMYGGHKGREIYNPNIKPEQHRTFSQYKKSSGPTINHFYEKLLLLKARMNTRTGKKMATARHAYMEKYLKQFYKEWERKL